MADAVVLDPSACMALLENEAGADIVETHLLEARAGRAAIHGSFATLTEVEYITTQERNATDAGEALAKIKAWLVQWHHTDDVMCSAAAKLKAAHKLSFADSFIVALAQRLDATLLHKDPEMDAPGDAVKQRMLPPKSEALI